MSHLNQSGRQHKISIIHLSTIIALILNQCTSLPFDSTDIFDDGWQWQPSMVSRSLEPLLNPKNYQHDIPPEMSLIEGDDGLIRQLEVIQQNITSLLNPINLIEQTLLNLKQLASALEISIQSGVTCTACKAGAGLLQYFIEAGKSTAELVKIIFTYCVNLKIKSYIECEGLSNVYGTEVIYVLTHANLGPDEICSVVLGDACDDVYSALHEWEVVFPNVPKPEVNELKLPKEDASAFKVLHLSDTHYDPYYAEGSNAECLLPLCCRSSNGMPLTPAGGAGKWGEYRNCDTPKRTIDHMLAHIADVHHDIDYILWTGDLPPHDIWNQTREENLFILKETVKQMIENFPGIPIFPALGNHESVPVNSFPPPYLEAVGISNSWLYDELDVQWRTWLPANVSQTVRRGAFYSVLVRPGFRIISLNMNYCNNLNFWLLLNSTDPANELQWFIYELQNAEFAGEKVHVIGHIPPGYPDCLKVWSQNYYRIINRYENTITAQFFGHTHFDEFEVFYDPENLSRATSIAYIGPSVTPFVDLNPGYRIYYVDGDHAESTRLVIDHESWIMNLKEANLYDDPIWYKLYTTRAAYGMIGLRPQDWNDFILNMTENNNLFDLYYKHYWKDSPVRAGCDSECKKRILCDAKSGRSHDRYFLCGGVE